MATSRSGIRWPLSNISPKVFRKRGYGLRTARGMNLHRPVGAITLSADACANVARIQQIWVECRERYGKFGPFLFGAFGGADAMFAPVVHRFRLYAIAVEPEVQASMDAMM